MTESSYLRGECWKRGDQSMSIGTILLIILVIILLGGFRGAVGSTGQAITVAAD